MVIALMVLMIVTLLIAAAFVAANGDVENSRTTSTASAPTTSARAGLSRFLVLLNRTTSCGRPARRRRRRRSRADRSDLRYSYRPLPANGAVRVQRRRTPSGTFIDFNTGSFRMSFTGTSNGVSRTIVAQLPRRHPARLSSGTRCTRRSTRTPTPTRRTSRTARPSARQPAVQVRLHPVGHGRRAQRPDVHAGPVRRSAARRPSAARASRRTPSHGRSGPADGPGPDHDLGLHQQRRPQRRPWSRTRRYIDPPPDNTNLLPYAQQDGAVSTRARPSRSTLNGTSMTINAAASGRGQRGQHVALDRRLSDHLRDATAAAARRRYTPYFCRRERLHKSSTCGNVYVSGNYSTRR